VKHLDDPANALRGSPPFANGRMGTPVGNRVSSTLVIAVEDGMPHSPDLVSARNRVAIPVVRWVSLAIVAGALLAILGPFGSYMNGGPVRLLAYWVGAMLLGLALYGAAYGIVGVSTVVGSRRWWLALVGAALLASIPEALATRMAAFWLWPELAGLNLSFPLWFAQTTTIGVIMMAAVGFVLHRPAAMSHDAAGLPLLLDPVATPLAGEVLALQMEDHYVRVHRSSGSELILMPLNRAIEAVKAEGLRTHRSWWVATHAVTAVEGNARSLRLRLTNGVVAPVARSAVTHLRTAGWINDSPGR
jgi:hypothetical protein